MGERHDLLFLSLGYLSAIFIVFFLRTVHCEGDEDEEKDEQEVCDANGDDDVDEGINRHVPTFGQGDAPYLDDGKESNEHDK
mgnify:CR=1 FL=1